MGAVLRAGSAEPRNSKWRVFKTARTGRTGGFGSVKRLERGAIEPT
jgi:hypothetical protein